MSAFDKKTNNKSSDARRQIVKEEGSNEENRQEVADVKNKIK